ncbi:MAG: TonB-dependent receptor [Saprospiraceae bacterium]|nr:TonB-dependent receptor [Saprospiraceae bacterium]
MRSIKCTLIGLGMLLLQVSVSAQSITQTIRGNIVDKDIKTPLVGATIAITTTEVPLGAFSDSDGYFKIEKVPVGRHNIQITYLGYEPVIMNSILITSGKELVLNIEMLESAEQLAEVVITAESQLDKTKPLNEFATVSARTFSVEETSRYAFSAFDPARMAQNYAGVSLGSSDDLGNEIVIRGNSPTGVLWRLEGIQIPNPNHFGTMGSSGGGISMLSSSTLTNSDFYTGAFPAEFGNALSGVFDLNMRNGNNENREYSFMLGALGIELATEGPFAKSSKASYLVNYRYSTLAALGAIGLSPIGDVLPAYQDLSFKINVPTEKAGTFALFGLGGTNNAKFHPESDSLLWDTSDDKWGFVEYQTMGTIGLSHSILLSENSYLRTVAIGSYESNSEEDYFLDTENNYEKVLDERDEAQNINYRISSTYNLKFNANHSLRTGAILNYQSFRFLFDLREEGQTNLSRLFDNSGNTNFLQAFANWKYRMNPEWTFHAGVHASLMTLNNKYSIEPRAAAQWRMKPNQTLSFSAGLHSRMEHLAIYLFEGNIGEDHPIYPKTNLGLTKAAHLVLGYDLVFSPELRLKTELYYQYLYDVPVENDIESTKSILNATDIWDVIGISEASTAGTGQNIGIDVTLEKFFANQYYFLITGALYDSKFTPLNGKSYSTRFNGNYQINLVGGKEFSVGKKGNKTLGLNGKFALSGGNRMTPIDLESSMEKGYTVVFTDRAFEDRAGVYGRLDIGVSYRINAPRMTHTIMIDVQNVTNRANVFTKYYNGESNQIETWTQTGLFPNFNYRIEF